MEGAIAWLVKPAMDDIFIRRDQTMLRVIPLLLLGAYLFKGGARYGQSYLMAAVGERVIAGLRRTLYTHIQQMPLSFFADLHSAELMSRIVTDVNRLARVSSTVLVMTLRQMLMIVALLSVMVVREWRLAPLPVVGFPFLGGAGRSIRRRPLRIHQGPAGKGGRPKGPLPRAVPGMKS